VDCFTFAILARLASSCTSDLEAPLLVAAKARAWMEGGSEVRQKSFFSWKDLAW